MEIHNGEMTNGHPIVEAMVKAQPRIECDTTSHWSNDYDFASE
jgi:hypothetical protein